MSHHWMALLEELDAAFRHFITAAAQIDPAERERAGMSGIWSAREVVAHVAGWEEEGRSRIRALLAGPVVGVRYDFDATNARFVAARAEMSWDETLAELHTNHAQLTAALAEVSADALTAEPRFVEWVEALTNHYCEHAAEFASPAST
jgi:hypothetical protein